MTEPDPAAPGSTVADPWAMPERPLLSWDVGLFGPGTSNSTVHAFRPYRLLVLNRRLVVQPSGRPRPDAPELFYDGPGVILLRGEFDSNKYGYSHSSLLLPGPEGPVRVMVSIKAVALRAALEENGFRVIELADPFTVRGVGYLDASAVPEGQRSLLPAGLLR